MLFRTCLLLSLFAHDDTSNVTNIFSIKIGTDVTIGRFKEIIYKKRKQIYDAKLKLWKVEIDLDKPNEKLSILPDANIKKKLGGWEAVK